MADTTIRVTSDFLRVRSHAEVRCRRCGWTVIFPPHAAAALFPQPLDLAVAAKRLRCRKCGAKDANLRGLRKEYHG